MAATRPGPPRSSGSGSQWWAISWTSSALRGSACATTSLSRAPSSATRSAAHQSAKKGTERAAALRTIVRGSERSASATLALAVNRATCWARRSAPSARFFSVMSLAIFEAPTIAPEAPRIGEMVKDTWTRRPCFVIRTVSKCSIRSPRRRRSRMRVSSSCRSGGMRMPTGRPTSSAAA